jgi:hypothetical protein
MKAQALLASDSLTIDERQGDPLFPACEGPWTTATGRHIRSRTHQHFRRGIGNELAQILQSLNLCNT